MDTPHHPDPSTAPTMTARALLASLILLVGCSDPFQVVLDGLEVTADRSVITLTNRSDSTELAYFLVEAETATLIDLAPCEEWSRIDASGSIVVPYEEISGYSRDAVGAFLFWCRIDAGEPVEGGTVDIPLWL